MVNRDGGSSDAEYVNFSVYIWGVQPALILNQQFTHIGEGIYEVSLNSHCYPREHPVSLRN